MVIGRPRDEPPRKAWDIPAGEPGSWTWWHVGYQQDVHAQLYVSAFAAGMTLDMIGTAMGCSRERIRQIEAVALRKLRRRRAAVQLEEWLDWLAQERAEGVVW